MLLTLMLTPSTPIPALKRGKLEAIPAIVRDEFGLSGLNVSSALLKGADRAALASFRDAADRAGCACLVLVEPALPLASSRKAQAQSAIDRSLRLVEAAGVLGCNSLAMGVDGDTSDEAFERAVDALREVAAAAEKRELNVLISPGKGLTAEAERVTELIKRVGGFRVGTYPDFEVASKVADPVAYLRRLVPYAWAVSAATREFVDLGEEALEAEPEEGGDDDLAELLAAPQHVTYDLDALVEAVASVGYDGTLAVDYRGDAGTLGIRQSCEALESALARVAGG
ncbi:MAG: TIM barrel protein [Phycisphaerales bacterium]|nr:TIM barrel protein [Phycisphaerales bacterium]